MDHLKGVAERGEEFNAKLMMTNYALDSIASCGFGVETNSFKDPDGIFPTMVRQTEVIMRRTITVTLHTGKAGRRRRNQQPIAHVQSYPHARPPQGREVLQIQFY